MPRVKLKLETKGTWNLTSINNVFINNSKLLVSISILYQWMADGRFGEIGLNVLQPAVQERE